MFKIKDKWELKVLEEYGFKQMNYYKDEMVCTQNKVRYDLYKETRFLEVIGTDVCNITPDLSLLYRLIKDDIVELVQNTKDEYSFEVGV